MIFSRKKKAKSVDDLYAQIGELTESNRIDRDPTKERQIRQLRHLAGVEMVNADTPVPSYAAPAAAPPAQATGEGWPRPLAAPAGAGSAPRGDPGHGR